MRLQLKGGQLSHKAHIFAKFSQRLFKALFRHNKLKVIARNMNFVAFTFIFISNSFILPYYKLTSKKTSNGLILVTCIPQVSEVSQTISEPVLRLLDPAHPLLNQATLNHPAFKALFRHNKLKVIARNMNFVAFTFIFISNSFILPYYKLTSKKTSNGLILVTCIPQVSEVSQTISEPVLRLLDPAHPLLNQATLNHPASVLP